MRIGIHWEQCLFCHHHRAQRTGLCDACHRDLPRHRPGCARCGDWLAFTPDDPAASLLCTACQANPPDFHHCWTPFRYEFPIRQFIGMFKQPDKPGLARQLGHLFAAALPDDLPRPAALVPVPVHRNQWLVRGHHPAALLAHALSRHTGIPVSHCVRKVIATPPQKSLKRAARHHNLANAFVLDTRALRARPVQGLHLAIIDDVYTTGATANAMARCLLQAGSTCVDAWMLARTPFPDD